MHFKLPVVTHTRDLSLSVHITDIVSKAHQRAGLILRTFIYRDIHLFMRAFMVYVRPIVEYNSIIWSSYTVRDIDAVQSVQRRFTKRLPTLKNLSYRERLKCLNIFSSELRRLHTYLFWCYKIVFGLVYVNLDDLFVLAPASTLVVTGHKFKLCKRLF